MQKKYGLVLFLLIIGSRFSDAQDQQSILVAPDNWKGEIIPFPLNFAPSIDYIGFEDLRFAPGWSDSSSQNFWTYTFAWYIEKGPLLTEKKLSENFEVYFDGLMGLVSKEKADSIQLEKTMVLFVKTAEGFTGKVRLYDAFFTKKYFILNVKVVETFCAEANKQLVLFEISPKSFENRVWDIFKDIKPKCK